MTEEEKNIEALIWRFHQNEISSEELLFLELWLDRAENQRLFNELSNVYFALHHQKIVFNIDDAWLSVNQRIDKKKGHARRSMLIKLASAAAVVFLGLFAWWMQDPTSLTESNYITYIASDSTLSVTLPDGTVVDLREGSKLNLEEGFGDNHRNLQLQGEAFFDVVRNTKLPFRISTQKSLTEVLGTSFLLQEHDDGNTNLIVYSGKVKFSDAQGMHHLILEKDESAIVSSTGDLLTTGQETFNPLFWKTKELSYRNVAVEQVLTEVELLFDLNVSYNSDLAANCKFTGRFHDADAETVIKSMCESFGWQYLITGNSVIINNTECR
jgi:transmembrane sensor